MSPAYWKLAETASKVELLQRIDVLEEENQRLKAEVARLRKDQNLLRDLTIATLTPSGLNEIAERPVVRRYRDAHRALFNLEVDQLLPAPVTGLRSLNSNCLVNCIGRTFSAVTFVSFRRTASVGDTRHLRVRLEGDLRGRRIIAKGLLPRSALREFYYIL